MVSAAMELGKSLKLQRHPLRYKPGYLMPAMACTGEETPAEASLHRSLTVTRQQFLFCYAQSKNKMHLNKQERCTPNLAEYTGT